MEAPSNRLLVQAVLVLIFTNQLPLLRLFPFNDDQGLIRVDGKLENDTLPFDVQHPIILPRCSRVTELIIDHFNKRAKHQGKGMTMNEILSHGIWIIGLNNAVASRVYKCVQCRRQRGSKEGQKIADLPKDGVKSTPLLKILWNVLLWAVHHRGKLRRKELKIYAVIFTCMNSRVVHIEQLDDTTLMLSSRPLQVLHSNLRTNPTAKIRPGLCRSELVDAMKELDNDRIESYFTTNRYEFVMNVSYSCHRGARGVVGLQEAFLALFSTITKEELTRPHCPPLV